MKKIIFIVLFAVTATTAYADCSSFGSYETRQICKGDCSAGTSYEIREVCKGNASAAPTYELRQAAKGDCTALETYQLREACKSCSNKAKWTALYMSGELLSCK